jgi:pimeloyl-ACP methyl ester carboxylesterase
MVPSNETPAMAPLRKYSRHRRRVGSRLGAALTVLVLAIGARAHAAPPFEPGACSFALPPSRTAASVRCGALVVPENRDEPTGRTLRLAVAVFKNPSATTASDPIVFLSGGPGGSALEYLRYTFDPLFAGLTPSGRDVIVFDQRGVGVSQPALDCALETGTIDDWLACAERLRATADLGQYHTAWNAADVNDLRIALGYDRVNLWGGSYGTRLALDVMRDYPQAVRSVVLDSVYPPDVDLQVEAPANAQRAFDHLFASCAAEASCAAAFPDLRRTLVAAVARLDAEPARIRTLNPFTGAAIELPLSGGELVNVVFAFLYASELVPSLPLLIDDAAAGRFGVIERYLGAFVAQSTATSVGMQVSVFCHDEVAFSSKAAQEASVGAFPLVAPAFRQATIGTQIYDICPGWGAGRAADVENQAVSSEVPALLLAGEFDPITPPEWAHRAARTLPNGRAYQFPGLGHGIGHDPCGRSILLAFVADPSAPLPTGCATARRVSWVLPGRAAAMSDGPAVEALAARLAISGGDAFRPARLRPR